MKKTNDIVACGNALMDLLIETDESRLSEWNLNKSEMHIVDEDRAKRILEETNISEKSIEKAPGGAAANTTRALAFLGGKAIFSGKVGNDSLGEDFINQLISQGVNARIKKHQKITGHALTFITPDAERTFSVHLGAATELCKEDILEEDIIKSKILYLEGFQLEGQTRETILHTVQIAKKHNTLIALDLNDKSLIRRNKEDFKEIIKEHIDIIFANENEAEELTGLSGEDAAREIGRHVTIAVVKLGEKGSLIYHDNSIIKIKPFKADAIDTTGAGDTFAAGFLYGYCNGWNMQKAGTLGSLAAAKVVEKKGVHFDREEMEKIKEEIGKSDSQ